MTTWGTDIRQNTSVIRTGAYSVEFISGHTGCLVTDYIPVTPGRPYRGWVWWRSDEGEDGGDSTAYVTWYTAAKVSISSDDIFPDAMISGNNVWFEEETILTAPATAGFARVFVTKVNESVQPWTLYLDSAGIDDFPFTARGYRTMVQTIQDSTITRIQFDGEVHDYGGIFTPVSTGAITAYADAGGGQVTVTSANHGLSNGDIVQITNSTNYNSVYTISNVATNTFRITAVWAGDDGASTWDVGGTIVIPVTGIYDLYGMAVLVVPVDTPVTCYLYKNNALLWLGTATTVGGAAGTASPALIAHAPGIMLSAGDEIDFRVYHTAGAPKDTTFGSAPTALCCVQRLR